MTNPAPAKVDHYNLVFPDFPAEPEPAYITPSTIAGLNTVSNFGSPEGAGMLYWYGGSTGVLEWIPSNNVSNGGVVLSDLGIPSSYGFLLHNTVNPPYTGILINWVLASLPASDVSQLILIVAANGGIPRPVILHGIPGLTLQMNSAASLPDRPIRYNYYAIITEGAVETRIQITAFQFSRSSETGKEYLSVTTKDIPEGLTIEAIIDLWEIARHSDGTEYERSIASVTMTDPIQASYGPESSTKTISGTILRDYEYRGLEFTIDNIIKEGETTSGVFEFQILGGYYTRIFPGDIIISPSAVRYVIIGGQTNCSSNSVGTIVRAELE